MAQTAYSTSPGKGDRGDLSGSGDQDVATFNNPSAIAYGLMAQYQVGSDFKVQPYEGGAMAGVVVASKSNTTEGSWPAKSAVPAIRKGVIWVPTEQDVTPDDPVYVRKSVEPEVFTVTLNADFVALNTVSGQVDGSAITPVTFNVDHNSTMAAFSLAIQALANVATATVTAAREITVVGQDVGKKLTGVATSFAIAGGASQANIAIAAVTGPSGGSELGAFRKDANNVGNGATAVLLASAKFLTTASAGGNVLLDLNL